MPKTKVNFGLIKRDYETDKVIDPDHIKSQWQRFAYYVKTLNNTAAASTQYKILFLARHGQGYHNVAERLYGTPAWNVSIATTHSTRAIAGAN